MKPTLRHTTEMAETAFNIKLCHSHSSMSWTRFSTLREQESALGCAVKANIDISNVGVLCWGCQGHQWVCGTHECSSHLLPTGCSRPLRETGRIEQLAPQEERKTWGRDRAWSQQGTRTIYKRLRESRDKGEEGQKGRTSLHPDRLVWTQGRGHSENTWEGPAGPRYKVWIWGWQARWTIPRNWAG